MKISLYLPSLYGGGAERSMVTLANGFADRGYKVDLVLARAEGSYLKDVLPTVSIINLASKGVLRSVPGLVRYLKRSEPSVILSAMGHANVVVIISRFVAGVKARLIISERESLVAAMTMRRGWKDRFIRILMRLLYPYADKIVAVSSAMRDELITEFSLPPKSVYSIYNPVVNPGLFQLSNNKVDHSWFKEKNSKIILSVGRLTFQKDYQSLIKAFSILRSYGRPERLVILGDGEDRETLESLVSKLGLQDSVSLPGFVENPFAYMRQASLFVLSSRWEGLPGVLIQAMACGCAVVSTDCPTGPSEILENGKWGRLVPIGDISALATAMQETLDDKMHPDVKARAFDFSEDNAISRYLDLFKAKNN